MDHLSARIEMLKRSHHYLLVQHDRETCAALKRHWMQLATHYFCQLAAAINERNERLLAEHEYDRDLILRIRNGQVGSGMKCR